MPVKKVVVICSASVVTSMIIAEKLEKLFEENGIDARIDTGLLKEAADLIPGSDLVVSTVFLSTDFGVPVASGVPFLTGSDMERVVPKILAVLAKENSLGWTTHVCRQASSRNGDRSQQD